MVDRWTDRLSEYLDGGLGDSEREELEVHLAECEDCGTVLEQLRGVVERAGSLEDRSPTSDLWVGISERIAVGPRDVEVVELAARRHRKEARVWRRRLTFSFPQLAAASIALIVLSAGTAWLASGGPLRVGRDATDTASVPASAAVFTASSYDAAVAELEWIIEDSREQLDPATVEIIEENLLKIDQAIAQAQRALAEDPASAYLNEYLAATMRQKLEFLRRAAQLTGAVS